MPTGPRGPTRIVAVALLVVAATALAVVLLDSGGSSYVVHARFENASQLVKGDLVQVSGQRAGQVTKVGLAPDGEADVTLRIDDEFAPLRRGTRASVRLRSLLGEANRYVDLQLGSGTASDMPSGAVLDSTHTVSSVDLDSVLDLFDARVRRAAQRFVAGNARQFAGRGLPAGRGLTYLAPFLQSTDRVAAELARDRPALRRFVVRGAALARDVAARRDHLQALVGHLATTGTALASEQANLSRGIARLPAFLREGDRTFTRLRGTLRTLTPLVKETKPLAPRLVPFMRTLRAFATDAGPTVRSLSRAVGRPGADNDLRDLLARARPLGQAATSAFPVTARALHGVRPSAAFLRPYAIDLTGWFNDFGASGVYDATGGVSRASTTVGAFQNLNGVLYPIPPDLRGDAFQRTATLGQMNRCPGSVAHVQPDGSVPWRPDGLNCDPTQVPPGP